MVILTAIRDKKGSVVHQTERGFSRGKRLGLLHRQIAQELKSDIQAGIYADGDPFPSETSLVARYGVSRVTIRSALSLLQEEGLIQRIQGSGTVVHSHVHHKLLARIVNFHREAIMMGRTPSSRVLSISRRKSRIRERILFDIPSGEEVIELRRLRFLDGVPVVLQTSSHPKDVLHGVKKADLRDCSLYEFLRRRKGIVVRDAKHMLEPFSVGPEEAKLLQIPPGTAVMKAHRTSRDTSGRTLEIAENLIRGDYYKYSFSLQANEEDG
jgi:GntR family transcriptional regulator